MVVKVSRSEISCRCSFERLLRQLDTAFLRSYAWNMEVHLTPDQEAFVRQAIASGRLQCEEEAVQEAIALWEERERNRGAILTALDEAEGDLNAGRFNDYTEASLSGLAEDLKVEARALRSGHV